MSTKPMCMRTLIPILSVTVLAAAAASCGDVVRSSRSPVILSVNSLVAGKTSSGTLQSDVVQVLTTPDPCSVKTPCSTIFNDSGSATLAVVSKDATLTPTTNNSVTITGYHVEYRRADGHNTPGVDIPFPFDGGITLTIDAGSTGTIGFELVRHVAKEESPLVQLQTNRNIIYTVTDVTFYGTDRVGNAVSATGAISIDFGNFADTP